jgi:glutamyl-tRNA synthetase
MTILNSDFEEWSLKNPDKDLTEFKFRIEKMGKSGALFDLDKLNDISRTEISKLSESECFDFLKSWVDEFGTDADKAHFENRAYIESILTLIMGVGGKKRRKDIERSEQGVRLLDYFFDDTFAPAYEYRQDKQTVNAVLDKFMAVYNPADDNNAWFAKVKGIAAEVGFAAEMSEYKAHPENFKGNVSDIAEILRIATTGMANSPDLCTIMKILGKDRTLKRLNQARV